MTPQTGNLSSRLLCCGVIWDIPLSKITIQQLPTQVSQFILRPVMTFKESCFREYKAPVGDISLVVVILDVFKYSRGIRGEAFINLIVATEPVQNIVVYRTEPPDSFSHFFIAAIAHRHQLSTALLRSFSPIGEFQSPITGKRLSETLCIVSTDHAPGSQIESTRKDPDSCMHQEPGKWSEDFRMQTNEFDRLKAGGTIAAQTPSRASAPDQLGTLVGADTPRVTATDQSTQTGAKPRPGGGRRVRV